MSKTILFPNPESWTKRNEYSQHYQFIKKYGQLNGYKVRMHGKTSKVYCGHPVHFSIDYNGQQVVIDYSDHEPLNGLKSGVAVLKYHYHPEVHGMHENVFPVGPMVDLPDLDTYKRFFDITEENIYDASGDIIINCQRPRLNAKVRRTHVQNLLTRTYGSNADVSFEKRNQEGFWRKHKNCLVGVAVPGARNNMLDRGQYEQIGLGVCTISPLIRTVMPGGKPLEPGKHYLMCKDDYSDLTAIIDWCRDNRGKAHQVGKNAQQFFKENCMPGPYWEWVDSCLAKVGHAI